VKGYDRGVCMSMGMDQGAGARITAPQLLQRHMGFSAPCRLMVSWLQRQTSRFQKFPQK
jgi:hypothetical protein